MDDFKMGQTHHVGQSGDSGIEQIWLWHRRFGHSSFGYLKHLLSSLFSDFSISDFQCESCILAKSHWAIYPLHKNKSDVLFSLIHSDVWGPSQKSTLSGYHRFVLFVNDCTRMTWLYLLKNKDEVFIVFYSFHTMIQTQFSAKFRVIRFENDGEYMS